MLNHTTPFSEDRRLAAMDSYAILDTSTEQDYDDIVQLAATICDAPIALLSLVDATRQWFKAKTGIDASETPRELAFCAHAILDPDKTLIVPDAQQDARFANNALVTGEPHIRFYAGAPLITPEGYALGTLCVIDRTPRVLSEGQEATLRVLARQVMTLLELRRQIAARKLIENALRETEARFRAMSDASPLGIYVTTPNGDCVYVNEKWEGIAGLSMEEARGAGWGNALYEEDREQVSAAWYEAARNNTLFDQTYRFQRPDKSLVWIHGQAAAMRGHNGEMLGYVGVVQNITERVETLHQIEATNSNLEASNQGLEAMNTLIEEQILLVNEQAVMLEAQKVELEQANALLKTLATMDGLTGIANHRAFQERLAKEWERSKRYYNVFSVILLDVDKFKQFNDAFGHPEGDTVLKMVAKALGSVARDVDLVARYGGEEFVIILPETNAQGAMDAAERFRVAIESQDWLLRPVTASFGVATQSLSSASAQELITAADKALYMSKQTGRNRVTHTNTIAEALNSP